MSCVMKYKQINNHKNIALSFFTQNIYSLLTWARYAHKHHESALGAGAFFKFQFFH